MRFAELITEAEEIISSGPPYPPEDRDTVKLMQTKLQALGYDLGAPGVDGKFGPYTSRAIRAWKMDNSLKGSALEMSRSDIEKLLSTNKMASKPVAKDDDKDDSVKGNITLKDARASAESYLGREMSDKEWNYLVRATIAEASQNTKERGYVMAVILNRARKGYGGDTDIVDILTQKNQFQAVTGTRYDPGPSKHFRSPPTKQQLASITKAALTVLPKADRSYLNFTAADPKAYGKGTNINFLKQLKDKGGVKIGKTIFGTA